MGKGKGTTLRLVPFLSRAIQAKGACCGLVFSCCSIGVGSFAA